MEIEEERNAKNVVESHLRECQRLVQELQLRERDLRHEVDSLAEKNSQLASEAAATETLRDQKSQIEREL